MAKIRSHKRKKWDNDLSHLKVDVSNLDEWQGELIRHWGDLAIRAGRQVGKSFGLAKKIAVFVTQNKGVNLLIIAAAEREASFLYDKVRFELENLSEPVFSEKPTLNNIKLRNGSIVMQMPTGRTGNLIRGLTLDVIVPDECAFISDLVFISLMPMLAISRKLRGFGWIWAASTPWGDTGFFRDCFDDPDFKHFHISSENCDRIPKSFLIKQKQRLSNRDYQQEWLGEFVGSAGKVFPAELLKGAIVDYKINQIKTFGEQNFLGVDFARFGGDENAFLGMGYNVQTKRLRIRYKEVYIKTPTTKPKKTVLDLHQRFNYNLILTDEGGFGVGLTDDLIDLLPGVVMGVNNQHSSKKKLKHKGRLLKEDLYSLTVRMLENTYTTDTPFLELPNDLDILRSLESVEFKESEETGHIKIFGNNTHLAEALVRACWGIKERFLNLYIYGS